METPQELWNTITSYAQAGFHEINAFQGLFIAVIAAIILHRWLGVFAVALGAAVVHLVLDVMLPVMANGAQFLLPNILDGAYWRYALTLYVGYVIVISVFYLIKRVFVNTEHQVA
ncbi:MAG: hypothetical protein ABL973_09795 [Micropepsaceae bacterium]